MIASCPPDLWWVKLSDFGLSKRTDGTQRFSGGLGTEGFLAPDLLVKFTSQEDTTIITRDEWFAGDIWSVGETIVRILSGKPSFMFSQDLLGFYHQDEDIPLTNLQKAGSSSSLRDFIRKTMRAKPSDRLTISSALNHKWLKTPEAVTSTGAINEPARYYRIFLILLISLMSSLKSSSLPVMTEQRSGASSAPEIPTQSVLSVSMLNTIKRKPLSAQQDTRISTNPDMRRGSRANSETQAGGESNLKLRNITASRGESSTSHLSTKSLQPTDILQRVATQDLPSTIEPEPADAGGLQLAKARRTSPASDDDDFQPNFDFGGQTGRSEYLSMSFFLQFKLEPSPGEITMQSFSPDSKKLLGVSDDWIVLWDMKTRLITAKQKAILKFTCVDFTRDSKRVILGGIDGTIRIARADENLAFRTLLNLDCKVTFVSSSQDSKHAVYSLTDGSIGLVSLETPDARPRMIPGVKSSRDGIKSPYTGVYFTQEGDLISMSEDGYLVVRDATMDFRANKRAGARRKSIQLVARCERSETFAIKSGSDINIVQRQDSGRFQTIRGIRANSKDIVSLSVTHKGSQTAACYGDGAIDIWYEDRRFLNLRSTDPQTRLISYSPNRLWLLATRSDGSMDILDVRKIGRFYDLRTHINSAIFMRMCPKGQIMASIGNMTVGPNPGKIPFTPSINTIALWDVKRAAILRLLPNDSAESCIAAISFSPDSSLVATTAFNFVTTVWNVGTGEKVRSFGKQTDRNVIMTCAAYSSDFIYLATSENTHLEGAIRLWVLDPGVSNAFWGYFRRGNPAKSLEICPKDGFTALEFSRDAKTLIAGSYHAFFVFEVETGIILKKLAEPWKPTRLYFQPTDMTGRHGPEVEHAPLMPPYEDQVVISPDQSMAAYLTTQKVILYDLGAGTYVATFYGDVRRRARTVAITPDFRLIALVNEWKEISIWDVSTQKLRRVLINREKRGAWSVGAQKLVRMMSNEKNPRHSRDLSQRPYIYTSVAFSPDSKHLFAGTAEGTIHVFDVDDSTRPPIKLDVAARHGSSGPVPILSIGVSTNYQRISVTHGGNSVGIWGYKSGTFVRHFYGLNVPLRHTWNPSGEPLRLAVNPGGYDAPKLKQAQ